MGRDKTIQGDGVRGDKVEGHKVTIGGDVGRDVIIGDTIIQPPPPGVSCMRFAGRNRRRASGGAVEMRMQVDAGATKRRRYETRRLTRKLSD